MASPFAREAYEIFSPRIVIRTPTAADAEAYLGLLQTPENFPFMDQETDLTLESIQKRIGIFRDKAAAGRACFAVICLRETGELIGQGGYNVFEAVAEEEKEEGEEGEQKPKSKKWLADVGFILDHRHWRKGYGLEIICALLEYAKAELGCDLFRTETDDENVPWRSLLSAAGLGAFGRRAKASYDEKIECWAWRFGKDDWEKAKDGMLAQGKWPL